MSSQPIIPKKVQGARDAMYSWWISFKDTDGKAKKRTFHSEPKTGTDVFIPSFWKQKSYASLVKRNLAKNTLYVAHCYLNLNVSGAVNKWLKWLGKSGYNLAAYGLEKVENPLIEKIRGDGKSYNCNYLYNYTTNRRETKPANAWMLKPMTGRRDERFNLKDDYAMNLQTFCKDLATFIPRNMLNSIYTYWTWVKKENQGKHFATDDFKTEGRLEPFNPTSEELQNFFNPPKTEEKPQEEIKTTEVKTTMKEHHDTMSEVARLNLKLENLRNEWRTVKKNKALDFEQRIQKLSQIENIAQGIKTQIKSLETPKPPQIEVDFKEEPPSESKPETKVKQTPKMGNIKKRLREIQEQKAEISNEQLNKNKQKQYADTERMYKNGEITYEEYQRETKIPKTIIEGIPKYLDEVHLEYFDHVLSKNEISDAIEFFEKTKAEFLGEQGNKPAPKHKKKRVELANHTEKEWQEMADALFRKNKEINKIQEKNDKLEAQNAKLKNADKSLIKELQEKLQSHIHYANNLEKRVKVHEDLLKEKNREMEIYLKELEQKEKTVKVKLPENIAEGLHFLKEDSEMPTVPALKESHTNIPIDQYQYFRNLGDYFLHLKYN